MKILRISAQVLLASFFAFIQGCSSTSGPGNNNNTSLSSIPTNGSTFSLYTNSGGGFLDPTTYTVAASSKQHLSDSKVIMLIGLHSNGQVDTSYESFESNGDVSLWSPTWNNGAWSTLPFASRTAVNTSSDQGSGLKINSVAMGNGSGGKFTVPGVSGNPYSTDSVTVKQYTVDNGVTDDSTIEHYSFIPTLGLIAIDRTDGSPGVPGSLDSLTQYSPK